MVSLRSCSYQTLFLRVKLMQSPVPWLSIKFGHSPNLLILVAMVLSDGHYRFDCEWQLEGLQIDLEIDLEM